MFTKKYNNPVLKKYAVASLLSLSSMSAMAAAPMTSATFTMYDSTGGIVGSEDTSVTGNIDSDSSTWGVASTVTFFGQTWAAHSGTTFGPGTYSFNTIQGGTYTGVTVGTGQVGGHILFNWGVTADIDVVNVWDVTGTDTATTTYTSTDVISGDGTGANTPVNQGNGAPDGILGQGMIDGAFINFNANFDFIAPTPPTATDDAINAAAGVLVNFDVRDNDTNYVGGATITGGVTPGAATIVTAGGTLTQLGDQTFNYTAASAGSYVFPYTIANDIDNLATATGTVTITVTAAPVANDVTFSTNTDVVKAIAITDPDDFAVDIATDADTATASLTFVNISATTLVGSTVSGTGTDSLSYTPPTGVNGVVDTFTFQVFDGVNTSAVKTMTIAVNNALPVANDDLVSAAPNTPITINILGNDSDAEDGAPPPASTVTSVTATTNAALGASTPVINGDGTITYQSGNLNQGTDTFDYTLIDSHGGTNTATVTVTVTNTVNNPPVTANVDFNTDAGVPLAINFASTDDTGGDLVATDADGHVLTFSAALTPTTLGGKVAGLGTSEITYTPPVGVSGVDTFTFVVSDGFATSNQSTMSITVNAVAPVAVEDSVETLLDVPVTIDVVANDTDADGDTPPDVAGTTAFVTLVTNDGNAVNNNDGTVTYTPASIGSKSFTYTVTDTDTKVSNIATVSITVTAAPVSQAVDETIAEDTKFSINVATVATDADGDTLTFDAITAITTANGAVTLDGTNKILTYIPKTDFNGTDSFDYTVTDGTNFSTSTVNVTVTAVEDAMVCQNASFSTAVDTQLQITSDSLIGGCTDVDGPVTLADYTQPTVIGSTVTGDVVGGILTYTPNLGFNGADSFTFTASDGTVTGDKTYTVSIAVIDDPAIHIITSSNFTMIDPTGGLVGGATDISGVFNERLICNSESCTDFAMTTPLSTSQKFFAADWKAHDIRVFGPGSYSFDSGCFSAEITAGQTSCGGAFQTVLNVSADQLGAHMLFDWGAVDATTSCGVANCDIHVAVLWNYNTAFGTPIYDGDCAASATTCDTTQTPTRAWNWASIDGDNNGFRGIAMVDGPFEGFHANFNLDMTAGYTPPLANNDNTSTMPGLLKTIDVLANDSDAEDGAPPVGATVTLLSTTSAQGGTLTNYGDGTVDYTPAPTLVVGDTDSFQYTITDVGGAVSNEATVTISITDTINTAPVAYDASLSVDEDVALTINVANSAVASDTESDPLTFATFDAASANGGTVTINGTMTALIYTPQANFSGTDTFNFSVNDGLEDSTVATMTITVNPVNDAPVCVDVTLATGVDTPLVIDAADLVVDCTDIEGDTVTFSSAEAPANTASTLVDDYAGTLTYTPETGLNGSDSFVFTATDGNGGNATATAEILVGTVYGNFTMLDKQGEVFGGTNDVVFTWDGVSMHSAETDLASNMTIVSDGPHPFFGAPWFAHHVRVFGPGTYTFEADNKLCQSKIASPDAANASTKTLYGTAYDIDVTGCPGTGTATTMSMTVADGQIGVHILFDYNGSFDIDVINVYDMNAAWNDPTGQGDDLNDLWVGAAGASPDPTTDWGLVSTDVNGDGVNGAPMVDGPFAGFYANFNDAPGGTAPPPAAITTTVKDTSVGGALNWLVLLGMLPLISLFRMRMK